MFSLLDIAALTQDPNLVTRSKQISILDLQILDNRDTETNLNEKKTLKVLESKSRRKEGGKYTSVSLVLGKLSSGTKSVGSESKLSVNNGMELKATEMPVNS